MITFLPNAQKWESLLVLKRLSSFVLLTINIEESTGYIYHCNDCIRSVHLTYQAKPYVVGRCHFIQLIYQVSQIRMQTNFKTVIFCLGKSILAALSLRRWGNKKYLGGRGTGWCGSHSSIYIACIVTKESEVSSPTYSVFSGIE
jgi:hypothetical protein